MLPGKDDRIGIERLAVVEGDVLAQVEGVLGAVVRDIPSLGQRGHDVAFFVGIDQAVVQLPGSVVRVSLRRYRQDERVREGREGDPQRALRSDGLGRDLYDLFHLDGLFNRNLDLDGPLDLDRHGLGRAGCGCHSDSRHQAQCDPGSLGA